MDKIETGKEERMVEWSFLNFQQQLACNGSEVQMVVDPGDAVKAKQATVNNRFLVAPLTF